MEMKKQTVGKRLLSLILIFMLAFSTVVTSDVALGVMNVQAATKKPAISKETATLCVEQSLKLAVNNTKEKVTWSVNKPKVVSVNKKGKVIALKKGTAKVTAKVGKKTYTCVVVVVKHNYEAATCTKPSTCKICKKTKGKELGHTANKATCTEDSVCSRCETVIEKAKGHDFKFVKCGEEMVCSVCEAKSEEKVDHDYQEVKCGQPLECSVCHAKSDKKAEHVAKKNDKPCTVDTVCEKCGELMKKAEHTRKIPDKKENLCLQDSVCDVCGEIYEKAKGHDFADATCTVAKKCKVCGTTEGEPLGHDYVTTVIEPTFKEDGYTQKKCKVCGDIVKSDYVKYVEAPISESTVKAALEAMRSNAEFMEGASWGTGSHKYTWDAMLQQENTYYVGTECASFAYQMSDAAFGKERQGRKYTDFSGIGSKIRVGDVIRWREAEGGEHEFIVIDVKADRIVIAEGNYNSSVHWDREILFTDLETRGMYYITRY